MKAILSRISAPCLGFALLAAPIAHGAPNQKIVPADAQWLVHLDFGALRTSELGEQIIAALPPVELPVENGGVRPNVQKILETIGTATAFGTNLSGDPEQIDGTLVLEGKAELRTIAEGMLTQMSVSNPDQVIERKDLPFEAYSIEGGVVIGLPKEPIILVSKSSERMLNALEVFRGKAASMSKSDSKLTPLVPSSDHFFVVAASVVPSAGGLFSEDLPQARILQMAQSASVALGSDGPNTVGQLRLSAASDDMATKLERIVLGMAALVSLAESSDQALTEFLNSIKVERDKNMVMLNLAYPTERIVKMLEDMKQAAQAVHEAPWQGGPQAQSAGPASGDDMGEVVAEWTANAGLPGDAPVPENLTTRTIENVEIKSGSTIVIAGRRGSGEHARVDYVELTPTGGSATPDRYEGEYMRLSNYQIEEVSFASSGEVIRIDEGRGTARFHFRGDDGSYTITVGYIDEADGEATFALGVMAPAEK